MNRHSKTDLLQALRAQLQHFDNSPDFGDGEAVAVIRKHLLLRIREAEGVLQSRVRLQPDAGIRKAFRSEAA